MARFYQPDLSENIKIAAEVLGLATDRNVMRGTLAL